MAIKALTGLVPEWYVTDSEKDDDGKAADDATSFHCFPLTQPQVLEVQQYYDHTRKSFKPQAYALAFMLGCRGWKNVFDHQGKVLRWSPISMEKIPAKELAEVGANIINMSVMGEDDQKNS